MELPYPENVLSRPQAVLDRLIELDEMIETVCLTLVAIDGVDNLNMAQALACAARAALKAFEDINIELADYVRAADVFRERKGVPGPRRVTPEEAVANFEASFAGPVDGDDEVEAQGLSLAEIFSRLGPLLEAAGVKLAQTGPHAGAATDPGPQKSAIAMGG